MKEIVESDLYSGSLAFLDDVRQLGYCLSNIIAKIAESPKRFLISSYPGSRIALISGASATFVILFWEVSATQILLERILALPSVGVAA